MRLKEKILQELQGRIPEKLLDGIPSRYPIIGNALILRLKEQLMKYGEEIGNTILKLLPNVKSVWAIETTKGILRQPRVRFLAGDRNPVVFHKELNTIFKVDIERLTFSPGNREERKRLLKIVRPSEVVVDLFACAGNLSLPIAVNIDIKRLYAVEINPYAFRFLVENVVLNNVQNKVVAIFGNNTKFMMRDIGDHVFMGFLPDQTPEQLLVALNAVKDGGLIHYHTLVTKGEEQIKSGKIIERILGLGYRPLLIEQQVVKSYSPSKNHVVYRIRIQK
ncbi:MAG: hypothetical protein NDP13_04890 [Crenarchaeota archaeon]|nr:hypothetical protein [Thermoproteota archaeon]MCR8454303.1 hypothetical protein [Thermoproteota archaeon]MCR8455071.1 hypothetical protein [Thermoproteota archaeon]MCR8463364.1 hypothetical protein [Thermoproteota archaeon]MCR8473492.1 hypothetical protein [Thermoproteota archaeon]